MSVVEVKLRSLLFILIYELLLLELICNLKLIQWVVHLNSFSLSVFSVCLIPDHCVAMTSEEEECPGVATSTATTLSAAAISKVTTATNRGDSKDAVTSSSPHRPSPYHFLCPEEKEEKEEEEIKEEGIIQEERIEEEEGEEEEEVVDCEGDDEDDDGSSDTSVLVVPYPELVPVVFFCLKQTTCPRSWCIRMVSSPYPFFSCE